MTAPEQVTPADLIAAGCDVIEQALDAAHAAGAPFPPQLAGKALATLRLIGLMMGPAQEPRC